MSTLTMIRTDFSNREANNIQYRECIRVMVIDSQFKAETAQFNLSELPS